MRDSRAGMEKRWSVRLTDDFAAQGRKPHVHDPRCDHGTSSQILDDLTAFQFKRECRPGGPSGTPPGALISVREARAPSNQGPLWMHFHVTCADRDLLVVATGSEVPLTSQPDAVVCGARLYCTGPLARAGLFACRVTSPLHFDRPPSTAAAVAEWLGRALATESSLLCAAQVRHG